MPFAEPVVIEVPGEPPLVASVPVELDDTNQAVALRLAPIFPPGTRLTVAGSQWLVGRQQPPAVTKLQSVEATAPGAAQGPRRTASGVRPKAAQAEDEPSQKSGS